MREPRREEEGGQTGRGSRSRMRMPWEKSQQRADPDHQVTTKSQEEGNTSAVLGMAGQCQE